jgi:hypothetical protein
VATSLNLKETAAETFGYAASLMHLTSHPECREAVEYGANPACGVDSRFPQVATAILSRSHCAWFKYGSRLADVSAQSPDTRNSQLVGRAELFERERHKEPVAGWHSCAVACAFGSSLPKGSLHDE